MSDPFLTSLREIKTFYMFELATSDYFSCCDALKIRSGSTSALEIEQILLELLAQKTQQKTKQKKWSWTPCETCQH